LINGKSQRIKVRAVLDEYQVALIKNASKLTLLRITQKSGKWIAQIAVKDPELITVHTDIVMGVDLGLKVPAVGICQGRSFIQNATTYLTNTGTLYVRIDVVWMI